MHSEQIQVEQETQKMVEPINIYKRPDTRQGNDGTSKGTIRILPGIFVRNTFLRVEFPIIKECIFNKEHISVFLEIKECIYTPFI